MFSGRVRVSEAEALTCGGFIMADRKKIVTIVVWVVIIAGIVVFGVK